VNHAVDDRGTPEVCPTRRVTTGPYHHLVGFNDLDPWSSREACLLCIRTEQMNRVPDGKLIAEVGVVRDDDGHFSSLGRTTGWNYPQGARQQWLRSGESDLVVFNRIAGETWAGTAVTLSGETALAFEQAVYCVSPDGRKAYGVNFARLNRLGGYGFAGLPDRTADEPLPKNDGIWQIDIQTGKAELLLSIWESASLPGPFSVPVQTDHYLTHLLPSPDGKRLAFLHRYWLPDGGIQTRLTVHQLDHGTSEVWNEGFLSHFDWIDSDAILIWSRPWGAMQALRTSQLLSTAPILASMVSRAKPLVRAVLGRKATENSGFRMVSSQSRFAPIAYSTCLPKGDGHPSFCATNRRWLVTDTYPDSHGMRRLLLCDVSTEEAYRIGVFTQSETEVDTANLADAFKSVSATVLRDVGLRALAYARSGVHCDLHPRWQTDGSRVFFDSNHEGTRQVYAVDVHGLTRS
jgi:hypothetical protein